MGCGLAQYALQARSSEGGWDTSGSVSGSQDWTRLLSDMICVSALRANYELLIGLVSQILDPRATLPSTNVLSFAALGGSVQCVAFILSHGYDTDMLLAAQAAAAVCDTPAVLQCLDAVSTVGGGTGSSPTANPPRNGYAAVSAAIHGSLPCLQYLHTTGSPLSTHTFTDGEMPYGECWNACSGAVYGGSVDCLRWAFEAGCGFNAYVAPWCALKGSLECVQYVHSVGGVLGPDTLYGACNSGSVDCVSYVVAHLQYTGIPPERYSNTLQYELPLASSAVWVPSPTFHAHTSCEGVYASGEKGVVCCGEGVLCKGCVCKIAQSVECAGKAVQCVECGAKRVRCDACVIKAVQCMACLEAAHCGHLSVLKFLREDCGFAWGCEVRNYYCCSSATITCPTGTAPLLLLR
jgi:hypothetical protein